MTKEENHLLERMEKELDTRDKRYMFLRLEFPRTLKMIDIEGSPIDACSNIFFYFQKCNMDGSLMTTFNAKFND